MKKGGFTLIELLAVIVLIAVLSIIAIPTFTGVIEKVRKEAVRDSAYGLIEAADLYFSMNSNDTFKCDGDRCSDLANNKLSFKGSVPTGGEIRAKNGSELYYVKINSYCVLGNRDVLDIQRDCYKLDNTKPTLDVIAVQSTSSKVMVKVNSKDIESGIKQIEYEVDGKTYKDDYDQDTVDITKTFEGLKAGVEYTVKVTVTNGNDLKETKQVSISTINLGILKIKFDNTPNTSKNGYFKSQTAYLDYDSSDATGYYIKTEKEAVSNVASTKSCGTNNSPSECISDSKTTLVENTWYYFEESPRITFDKTKNEENTIYARVTNGVSVSGNSTAVISKIDADEPSLELSEATVTSKSLNVDITTSDDKSGLGAQTCKYSTTKGSYTIDATIVDDERCRIIDINHNTTYYYEICSIDAVGNKKCLTGETKTLNLSVTLKSTNTPEESFGGYFKTQVWNLDTTGSPTGYYIKSTRAATSSVNLTKSCGSDTDPTTCTDITSTKNMGANIWYYTESKLSITYDKTATQTDTLLAKITDGKNTTVNASATVSMIKETLNAIEVEHVNSNWNVDNVQEALDELREGLKP
ncbi:MAG: type II secretion system protein [Bacilli bacterium]|nr:type II secretion system protein [Bacilli bacterium]